MSASHHDGCLEKFFCHLFENSAGSFLPTMCRSRNQNKNDYNVLNEKIPHRQRLTKDWNLNRCVVDSFHRKMIWIDSDAFKYSHFLSSIKFEKILKDFFLTKQKAKLAEFFHSCCAQLRRNSTLSNWLSILKVTFRLKTQAIQVP